MQFVWIVQGLFFLAILSFHDWQGFNKIPWKLDFLGVPISWSMSWENSVTSYHALCFVDDIAFFFFFFILILFLFSRVYGSFFPCYVCTNKLNYTCHTIKTWRIVCKTRLLRLHDVYHYHCYPREKHGLFISSRRPLPYMVYFGLFRRAKSLYLVRKTCSWYFFTTSLHFLLWNSFEDKVLVILTKSNFI